MELTDKQRMVWTSLCLLIPLAPASAQPQAPARDLPVAPAVVKLDEVTKRLTALLKETPAFSVETTTRWSLEGLSRVPGSPAAGSLRGRPRRSDWRLRPARTRNQRCCVPATASNCCGCTGAGVWPSSRGTKGA
jgi:hypothetical protein